MKTAEEKKVYNQMIMDIKNKVQWKTATFHERNILNMHNKKLKKQKEKAENNLIGKKLKQK